MSTQQLPLYEIPLDADLGNRLRAAAEARVQARVEAARQAAAARKTARAQMRTARNRGKAEAHRTKLQHLQQKRQNGGTAA